jgi:hypothetical protein
MSAQIANGRFTAIAMVGPMYLRGMFLIRLGTTYTFRHPAKFVKRLPSILIVILLVIAAVVGLPAADGDYD